MLQLKLIILGGQSFELFKVNSLILPFLNLCLEFVLKIVNLKLIFSPLHLLLRHLILHSIQLIFHHLHLNLILLGLILEREFLLLLIIDLNLNPLDLFLYFHL